MTRPDNDLLLRALLRQPVDTTPVWLMRQAGRYLPEYRATRAHAGSFMDLCRNANFATEVTLQPLSRFPLDAAILFSDILTVPDAMGLELSFAEGEGPRFAKPLREEAEILALTPPPMEKLAYVFEAVTSISRALDNRVPLIGFSGSPFTLACYMIEGGGSDDFRRVKALMYSRPELLHHILDVNARTVTEYLNQQIAHGAQAVMVFDTWGGILTSAAYEAFSLEYMRRIVAGLKREQDGQRIPVVLFTKGGGQWLEGMADTGCDALGLDWTVDPAAARARVGHRVALQGNLDPGVLMGTPAEVAREARRVLDAFGPAPGHVFNLGHGISQYTPHDNVRVLVETVHHYSHVLHANAPA
ncbi:MAG: uroporphyrinogen decarboxylase [Candidatus Dactylopiibacterium carminicum]|uniref:Uroporphyrinogen decarboxylase n=1 Tax=Candidatus Dactylopiibacterium carminicum TaxID=857335 RepID=A0A272EVL5_9RHOO|nr:uroporphyrinogen decarboxylase [Candidatus Dactylopiibacterium carminicum]KAF7599910.1 uroporphyrinogen decarboxylase [Candidatus Dactylopiibacterium carminicum]PAS94151.1 MAG: uroporphyrinogen decarboxylase [Candidatus Dactylopiibacterium carminicum]PAS96779.1 MAG: uroporphyrinogen decarboxylase [Candidatus Dactylopiibacterium carminicum]PAS99911.1 MAG: uroporphyrinogen decarboxylase [Candidatus Dactylopiibacterium carminicum]